MRKKLVTVATVFILCSIIIEYKVDKEHPDIRNNELINNQNKMLSYYIENDDGSYDLATSSTWSTEGYVFNEQLSKCEQGSSLSWDNNKKVVIVSANISDKCYIYFDKEEEKPKILSAEIDDYGIGSHSLSIKMNYESKYDVMTSYIIINDSKKIENWSEDILLFYMDDMYCPGYVFELKLVIKDINGNESNVYQLPKYTVTCFPAGTLIYTPDGYKDIEKIKISDIVYSFNENKRCIEPKKVTNFFEHNDTQLYEIHLENSIIKVTPFHRFYVCRNNKLIWLPVNQILKTDYLLNSYMGLVKIKSIKHKYVKENVYNFEVEENHTYFVSKDNILVHNAKDPC